MVDAMSNVTVIIPHISTRQSGLMRALGSVVSQTLPARSIKVMTDVFRDGSAITRNRGLHGVETPWVAFLDDDDELLPHHLETLVKAGLETGAQVVYPGCRVVDVNGAEIPRQEEWGRFGQTFDAGLLRQKSYIPVTSLVRTAVAQRALFGAPDGSVYDDWGFYLRALNNGAKFHHVPEVTWTWVHHGKNTSGRPDRW